MPEDLREKAEKWPSSLVLGVRPQDVLVHLKPPKYEVIKATLEIDEPMGDRAVLDLRIGEYLVKALVLHEFKAEIGDELWVEFPSDKIYVFDKATGKKIT